MDVSRQAEKNGGRQAKRDRGCRVGINGRRRAELDGRCQAKVARGEEDEDKRRIVGRYKKTLHSYLHL